uniref:Uncharacterized protein n=1 Tax=Psilocybe cubensis TaxID=181762 RepID=A0A8H7XMM1_PSICU
MSLRFRDQTQNPPRPRYPRLMESCVGDHHLPPIPEELKQYIRSEIDIIIRPITSKFQQIHHLKGARVDELMHEAFVERGWRSGST